MSDLHRLLAEVGLALALVGAAWSAVLVVSSRAPGRLYLVNLIWVVIVLVLGAALGAVMLVTGSGPRDGLHLVYGVLAVVTLPIAALVGSARSRGQQAGVGLIATVMLVLIVLRLFQTAG